MRDVVALRAVALAVVADEPELVGDAGDERAEGDDGDGGSQGGAGEFGSAAGRFAEGAQSCRMLGKGLGGSTCRWGRRFRKRWGKRACRTAPGAKRGAT